MIIKILFRVIVVKEIVPVIIIEILGVIVIVDIVGIIRMRGGRFRCGRFGGRRRFGRCFFGACAVDASRDPKALTALGGRRFGCSWLGCSRLRRRRLGRCGFRCSCGAFGGRFCSHRDGRRRGGFVGRFSRRAYTSCSTDGNCNYEKNRKEFFCHVHVEAPFSCRNIVWDSSILILRIGNTFLIQPLHHPVKPCARSAETASCCRTGEQTSD